MRFTGIIRVDHTTRQCDRVSRLGRVTPDDAYALFGDIQAINRTAICPIGNNRIVLSTTRYFRHTHREISQHRCLGNKGADDAITILRIIIAKVNPVNIFVVLSLGYISA